MPDILLDNRRVSVGARVSERSIFLQKRRNTMQTKPAVKLTLVADLKHQPGMAVETAVKSGAGDPSYRASHHQNEDGRWVPNS
jgi:hypothetical protein